MYQKLKMDYTNTPNQIWSPRQRYQVYLLDNFDVIKKRVKEKAILLSSQG